MTSSPKVSINFPVATRNPKMTIKKLKVKKTRKRSVSDALEISNSDPIESNAWR